jgi:hypothetical protein
LPSSSTSKTSSAGGRESASAIYLYCITQAPKGQPKKKAAKHADGRAAEPIEAQGVDGEGSVEATPCSGFVCWTSPVSREEFATRLNDNMQNLDWLAAASVRHQQVVAKIAKQGDVLPARFATVFLTPESLRQDVKKRARELRRNLQRVRGCDEWGVKIHALARPAPQPQAEDGRSYLQRKATLLQSRMRAKPDAAVEEFDKAVQRLSRESVVAGAMSQGQPGMIFQRSYLIPRKNHKRLLQVLERYSKKWAGERRIEATGPWPPYSFVSAGEDGAAP